MDDLRMQEWGGILPERPILICFLHFSLYLCLDALRAASALRSFSPAAVCRFLSLENMSSDKATKTACVKWDLNIDVFYYTQLSGFICSRTFLILAKW